MDWESRCEETERAKTEFARLIGASQDETAVGSPVSELVSAVVGALNYDGPRDHALVTGAAFPTIHHVWLARERHGTQLDCVPANGQHRIELLNYERVVTERTLLASVTQVYYFNGFKKGLHSVADIVHSLALADRHTARPQQLCCSRGIETNAVGPARIKDRIDMLNVYALSDCLRRGQLS